MMIDGTAARRVLLLAITLAGAAACAEGGASSDSNRADSTAAAATSAASTPAAGGTAAASATAGATTGAPQAPAAGGDVPRVQVTMKEWAMVISRDTVPAGTVVFDFVNGGTEDHELEVELGDREWEAGEVGPGGKGSMTTTLTPGTWIIYCPLSSPSANGSHKLRGQQTTIVVR